MIYLDEFSKNVNVKTHYAYSKKGQTKIRKTSIKKQNISVTAAISWEFGYMGHKACLGGSTAKVLLGFIHDLIIQYKLKQK